MLSISCDKTTLPNGLDLILHEDHSLPVVGVNIWYHVGSKDEEVGRTGFAHLFEHMMFAGSKNHDSGFFEPLEKIGANLNASTASDRTNYYVDAPSNYLELVLWLESDRMGFLLDALDQRKFDVQRDVVKNERRQSYENRPYGMAYLKLLPALFPPPHPYSWPTIGSQEDLDAAKLDDIRAFFRRFYAPSNASLAITGDFDPEAATRLVENYFGDIPPGLPIDRVGRMESALRGEVTITLRDKVQLPRLYLSWPTPPAFTAGEAPLTVLSMVLGGGKSSRLYRTLVYERRIARDVAVMEDAQEIAGDLTLQVTAAPGHSLAEIEDVVWTELARLREEPPEEREVERASNRIRSQHVKHLERIGGFGGRADQLNFYSTMTGDPGAVNTDLDRYMAVTAEDVQAAAAGLGDSFVRLSVLPEEPLEHAAAASVDRTLAPGAAATPSFAPPIPSRTRLDNGLDVVTVHRPGIPTVALGLALDAGAVTDPPDLPGAAHMVASMLPEGTRQRSSRDVSDEMEFLGSYLTTDASHEITIVSFEALTMHAEAALEIAADVVRNPTFPDHELERVRNEKLTDLRRIRDLPTTIASRVSRALLYGPDTSYGHPASGTERSIEGISRERISDHFNRHLGPVDASLVIVGDLEDSALLDSVKALFGVWGPQSKVGPHEIDAAGGPSGGAIFVADKPGAPQSVIRVGHPTIPRRHADYNALTLLNDIFGGQFTSRINMNLREDKGYSYGYMSTIEWARGPSALLAGGSVQTGVTKEALTETLREVSEIRGSRPVTRQEFDDARDGILRGFASRFETNSQIMQQVIGLTVFDLPLDYYSTYAAEIEALTLEDVRRAAVDRLDEEGLTVVIVGDREAIEPGLREIGLPVVPVDYEGRRLD